MSLIITPQQTPIRVNEDGVAYVGQTRVTLDTVIGCFIDGETAEGIVLHYPTLRLGDVYGAIHYYIDHTAEVDAYLAQRAREAQEIRQKVEAISPRWHPRTTAGQASRQEAMKFLADENFNNVIVRGVLYRHPAIDLVTVQEVGLASMSDPDILEWASANRRIVLTHDVNTMLNFAYERVEAGQPIAGVFGVPRNLTVRSAIDQIILIAFCSLDGEWEGRVSFLPL